MTNLAMELHSSYPAPRLQKSLSSLLDQDEQKLFSERRAYVDALCGVIGDRHRGPPLRLVMPGVTKSGRSFVANFVAAKVAKKFQDHAYYISCKVQDKADLVAQIGSTVFETKWRDTLQHLLCALRVQPGPWFMVLDDFDAAWNSINDRDKTMGLLLRGLLSTPGLHLLLTVKISFDPQSISQEFPYCVWQQHPMPRPIPLSRGWMWPGG